MYTKERILNLLDKEKIDYKLMEHKPVYTIEDMVKEGITEKGTILKNLFLRNAKGNMHYLISTYEDNQIDLKKLPKLIESTRLSFASPERLEKYLKLKPGSVSPFGLLNDEENEVVFILDSSIQEDELIGIHPNDNTATIWLKEKDLLNLLNKKGTPVKQIKF